MATTKTVTGTVTHIEQTGHTYYGNPIMHVSLALTHIDGTPAESEADVTFRISDNASLVYEIRNPEFETEPHTFHLTAAGRISHRQH